MAEGASATDRRRADLFQGSRRAYALDDVLRSFKGAKRKDAESVLDALAALGLLSAYEAGADRRWRVDLRGSN